MDTSVRDGLNKIIEDVKKDIISMEPYRIKLADINTANKMTAPTLIKDFIEAYDRSNYQLAKAKSLELRLDSILKGTEGLAYMERSFPYLAQHNIKDTAEARKQYVAIDEDSVFVRELCAEATSLSLLIINNLSTFRMAIDGVKRVAYDNSFMSPNG